MPIPSVEALRNHVMDVIKDGREYTVNELASAVGKKLSLSRSDLDELAPNGKTTQLCYRIAWAKSKLKKAGLAYYPSRGRVAIVERAERSPDGGGETQSNMPTFEDMMLPLLREIEGGGTYSMSDLVEAVAKRLKVPKDVLNILAPNRRMTKVRNRLSWAKSYLKKAGLVQYPSRGLVEITNKGKKVLGSDPNRIDRQLLNDIADLEPDPGGNSDSSTPEEIIEREHKKIDRMLKEELLEKVKGMSPDGFERMVLDLCRKVNGDTGDVVHTGRPGDGGIDGIIYDGGLGLDKTYVQAKRYKQAVTSQDVQAFIGALNSNVTRGIFITTADIPKPARKAAEKSDRSVRLVDGNELVCLMVRHNAGVTDSQTLIIKQMDEGYFEDFA